MYYVCVLSLHYVNTFPICIYVYVDVVTSTTIQSMCIICKHVHIYFISYYT